MSNEYIPWGQTSSIIKYMNKHSKSQKCYIVSLNPWIHISVTCLLKKSYYLFYEDWSLYHFKFYLLNTLSLKASRWCVDSVWWTSGQINVNAQPSRSCGGVSSVWPWRDLETWLSLSWHHAERAFQMQAITKLILIARNGENEDGHLLCEWVSSTTPGHIPEGTRTGRQQTHLHTCAYPALFTIAKLCARCA
jgi:hypothetical protein